MSVSSLPLPQPIGQAPQVDSKQVHRPTSASAPRARVPSASPSTAPAGLFGPSGLAWPPEVSLVSVTAPDEAAVDNDAGNSGSSLFSLQSEDSCNVSAMDHQFPSLSNRSSVFSESVSPQALAASRTLDCSTGSGGNVAPELVTAAINEALLNTRLDARTVVDPAALSVLEERIRAKVVSLGVPLSAPLTSPPDAASACITPKPPPAGSPPRGFRQTSVSVTSCFSAPGSSSDDLLNPLAMNVGHDHPSVVYVDRDRHDSPAKALCSSQVEQYVDAVSRNLTEIKIARHGVVPRYFRGMSRCSVRDNSPSASLDGNDSVHWHGRHGGNCSTSSSRARYVRFSPFDCREYDSFSVPEGDLRTPTSTSRGGGGRPRIVPSFSSTDDRLLLRAPDHIDVSSSASSSATPASTPAGTPAGADASDPFSEAQNRNAHALYAPGCGDSYASQPPLLLTAYADYGSRSPGVDPAGMFLRMSPDSGSISSFGGSATTLPPIVPRTPGMATPLRSTTPSILIRDKSGIGTPLRQRRSQCFYDRDAARPRAGSRVMTVVPTTDAKRASLVLQVPASGDGTASTSTSPTSLVSLLRPAPETSPLGHHMAPALLVVESLACPRPRSSADPLGRTSAEFAEALDSFRSSPSSSAGSPFTSTPRLSAPTDACRSGPPQPGSARICYKIIPSAAATHRSQLAKRAQDDYLLFTQLRMGLASSLVEDDPNSPDT